MNVKQLKKQEQVSASALADVEALIKTLETPYLKDVQTMLAHEIKRREAEKVHDAIDQMRKIAADIGMKLEDIVGQAKRTPRGPSGTVPAKYRNPANAAEEWTGRGRQPGWIKDALAGGATIESLAIVA